MLVDNEMELEAVKPACRTLTPPCQAVEYLVAGDSQVMTNFQRSGVDEGDASGFALAALKISQQWNHDRWCQLNEAVIAQLETLSLNASLHALYSMP